MIKAIFFDIDGTLFSHATWSVPASALDALHTLREKGVLMFIASGRPAAHLEKIRKDLVNFPFDGYVLFNGQFCADADGQPFFHRPLPVESLQVLISWLAQREDIICTFYELDRGYRNRPVTNLAQQAEYMRIRLPDLDILDPARCLRHPTYQLNSYIPPEMDAEFIAHAPGLKAVRWTEMFSDIIPADGGKPCGMQIMLDRFGIMTEESMAFGDGGIDIEMLQYAGIGVAMGNAPPEVKKAADYVTADIDEDGLARALQHFGLL